MKNSFLSSRTLLLMFSVMTVLFVSCIDGYEDDKTWSAGIENATLQSPLAEKVSIVPSADGSKLKVEWPVVLGAGGYEFSLYIVDDPDNPVLVGEENQVIDGTTAEREMKEDTFYEVVIRALGNPRFNNKEAEQATVVPFNNLLAVYKTIPNGTNLTEYFAANPNPETSEQLCYELEPDGEYTMNGNINIGRTSTVIRGNKVRHPKITLTEGSFVNSGAGFVLKFLDIDCSTFAGVPTSNALIMMDSNFDTALATAHSDGGYIVIPSTSPVAIQSCEIKGLKQYLFWDSNKKYAIGTILIKDCIIGQNTSTFNAATMRFQAGMVKDMTFNTSTFYNEVQGHGDNRICQISSGNATSVKPKTDVWANGTMTITQCTFYQFPKGAQSFNSNGAFGQPNDNLIIQNCLVVDSGEDGGFIRRWRRGISNPANGAKFTVGNNSYWYNGKFPSGEITSNRDESGSHLESDPQLTYLGNGEFRLSGSEQIAKRVGDPRWLPSAE